MLKQVKYLEAHVLNRTAIPFVENITQANMLNFLHNVAVKLIYLYLRCQMSWYMCFTLSDELEHGLYVVR